MEKRESKKKVYERLIPALKEAQQECLYCGDNGGCTKCAFFNKEKKFCRFSCGATDWDLD